jgi:hypothetical protein
MVTPLLPPYVYINCVYINLKTFLKDLLFYIISKKVHVPKTLHVVHLTKFFFYIYTAIDLYLEILYNFCNM